MFGSDSGNYTPFQCDPAFFAAYHSAPIFNTNANCYNACCCDPYSQINVSPEQLEEIRRFQAEKMAQDQKRREVIEAQVDNPFLDLTIVDVQ